MAPCLIAPNLGADPISIFVGELKKNWVKISTFPFFLDIMQHYQKYILDQTFCIPFFLGNATCCDRILIYFQAFRPSLCTPSPCHSRWTYRLDCSPCITTCYGIYLTQWVHPIGSDRPLWAAGEYCITQKKGKCSEFYPKCFECRLGYLVTVSWQDFCVCKRCEDFTWSPSTYR